MRLLLPIGLLLMVIGAVLLYQGGTFTTRKQIIDFGDVKVTAPEEHTVPLWAAGAAVVAGLGLVVAGARRRSRD